MLSNNKKSRNFSRRVFIILFAKLSLFFTLIGRLYYLQISKLDKYKTLSDSNRIKHVLIPPLRGDILDRNGVALASNKQYYRVLYNPNNSKSPTIDRITDILKLSKDEKEVLKNKIKKHNSRQALLLYKQLTWDEVAKLKVNSFDIPEILIDIAQKRFYPLGNLSPNSIGYLGSAPKSSHENPLFKIPDFKVGINGIEKIFEEQLRGKAGLNRIEVDAYGLAVRSLSKESATPGNNIELTIDYNLQKYTADRIKNVTASVSVINIENGDILALASSPNIDPNKFALGISAKEWTNLNNDINKPLINKALLSAYPPGSTFKTITAIAALEELDPTEEFYCPGHFKLGRRTFHCWKEQGHGKVNLHDAIKHSCNVYFYNIAKKINIDRLKQIANDFGLGNSLDLELQNHPGFVPSKKWKKRTFNENWQMGDTINSLIGQGYLLTTPLQLSVMSARIASGKKIEPNIILNKNKKFDNLNYRKLHLSIIKKAMSDVLNSYGGTAFGSRLKHKDFKMAGKTGTAQVISKNKLEMLEDKGAKELVRRNQHHGLFIGFAPIHKPKYAISVVVENGGSGSKAAAPIAKDIMNKIYKLNT